MESVHLQDGWQVLQFRSDASIFFANRQNYCENQLGCGGGDKSDLPVSGMTGGDVLNTRLGGGPAEVEIVRDCYEGTKLFDFQYYEAILVKPGQSPTVWANKLPSLHV